VKKQAKGWVISLKFKSLEKNVQRGVNNITNSKPQRERDRFLGIAFNALDKVERKKVPEGIAKIKTDVAGGGEGGNEERNQGVHKSSAANKSPRSKGKKVKRLIRGLLTLGSKDT